MSIASLKSEIVKLIASGFTLHEACSKLDLQYAHVSDWLSSDTVFSDDIKKAKEQVTDSMVDEAERQLMEAVRNGEKWAITYYLDNQGKRKGYNVKEEPTTVINNHMTLPDLTTGIHNILTHALNSSSSNNGPLIESTNYTTGQSNAIPSEIVETKNLIKKLASKPE